MQRWPPLRRFCAPGRIEKLIHDVRRAFLHLVVDPSDIFPQNANRYELHSAEKHNEDSQSRDAERIVLAGNQFHHGDVHPNQKSYARNRNAAHKRRSQENVREPDHAVKANLDRAEISLIVARAGGPWCAIEFHYSLVEANIGDQAPQEAMALFQLAKLIYDAPVHDPEFTSVTGNIDVRERIDDPVAKKRHELADEWFVLATAPAFRQDDIIAFLNLAVEIDDDLRRILEIDVDHHACFADAMVQPRHNGARLTETSTE